MLHSHESGISAVTAGTVATRDVRDRQTISRMDGKKFLLVKGRAGFGNRMLSALTGIAYARLTDRKLLVDWSDDLYSVDGSNVFHRFFQCSLYSPTDDIPATDSVRPSIWRGHLRESCIAMQKRNAPDTTGRSWWELSSIDLTKLDYPEDVVVMWTVVEKVDLFRNHLSATFREFEGATKQAILTTLLREHLILQPEIRRRVAHFKGNHFGKATVGVHVRYSDHRTHLWAILKALNTLLKREPNLQIFLSTDNIAVKEMFEESYPTVITTPHWYPPPGLSLTQTWARPIRAEQGIEALVDLYLLAECEYLIIDTSSSFSYVASHLTRAPRSHIFNVKRRGKRRAKQRRLMWRLWRKLGLFTWGLRVMRMAVKMQRFYSQ